MPDDRPLAGIRVRELGRARSSVLLGRLLEDLGADVIPGGDRPVASTAFERWLLSRDSVPTDLTETTHALSTTDVLVCDGQSADRLSAIGLSPSAVLERFPQLITVRLSNFGTSGPLKDTPATEPTLQALAGLMAATGEENDPPITSTVGLASRTAALSGLLAVSAALIGRVRGSGGDYFDIAEFDGLLGHVGTLLPVAAFGGAPTRRGNRHGMAAPWNSYPCSDAHVMVCTMGDAMWRRLVEVLDRPDLLEDRRFVDSPTRVKHVDELDDVIREWTSRRAAAEVLAALRSAEIPSAFIATPSDVRTSRELVTRGLVSDDAGEPRSPLRCLVPTMRTSEAGPRQGGLWRQVASSAPPLSGVRVLELASYTAGPLAGRLLAQLGADVLKVEPPHGEGSRRLAQQVDSVGYLYFVNNAGKRSCRLDLGREADRLQFDDLAAQADILLTNLSADTLTQSGIHPEQILPRRSLVHCAVTGHGLDHPGRSFDTVIQAESAIMHLVGTAAGAPRRTAVSSADVLGGHMAAASAALATYVRLRTRAGNSADVSLYDVAAWTTQESWFDQEQVGKEAPHVLEANDGVALVDGPWEPDDEDSVEGLVQRAAASGFPAAPLHDIRYAVRHPQVDARRMVLRQQVGDSEILIPGNHLRSLKHDMKDMPLAPVHEHDPAWKTEEITTSKGSR